ncbi:hypothetical protein [Dyadobacter sp. CY326]|uniref:hypothetical protein n=1 Tax=Dyadobacter sp. CY326 TaxID=2907300 RepID=UPI001F3C7D07|nr:hypothetical protein [Dyadobacter sp. CY326]MCE7066984.1 hypothetical protein [Dyadobacter sp. CY326]
MKRWTLAFLVFVATFQSCGFKEKEAQLAKREQKVAEKEQTLMQWEQRLALLDKDLQEKKKRQLQDSSAVNDSLQAQPFTGKWIVKMQCTETNCSGSAIGDSKTETWEIAYRNKGIVASAYAGNELSRVYHGSFSQNRLEVTNGQPGSASVMRVIMELTDGKMEGMREVQRADCKIRYALTAERPK